MGSCDDCPVDETDNKRVKTMFLLSHFLLVLRFEQQSKTW